MATGTWQRGWSAERVPVTTIRLIGPGRAGRSLAAALRSVGVAVPDPLRPGDDVSGAAEGVDAVVIATPDRAVAEVASAVRPVPGVVVVHLSGALGLDVLAPHARRGSLHPLVTLPDAEVGCERLLGGATFAVAGDPLVAELAAVLGGSTVAVPDGQRARYHAAATVAANHVVTVLGQVERLAAAAGVELDLFLDLARSAVDDVARLGPARALTGPAARGDEETLARHRAVLAADDRALYDAVAGAARRLATGALDSGASSVAPDARAVARGASSGSTVRAPRQEAQPCYAGDGGSSTWR